MKPKPGSVPPSDVVYVMWDMLSSGWECNCITEKDYDERRSYPVERYQRYVPESALRQANAEKESWENAANNSMNCGEHIQTQLVQTKALLSQQREALKFAEMTIEHALALGHCGEGSTMGMCKDALAKIKAALKEAP